ncbi:MAG TPA: nucleoside deaminase [Candidatus Omnitrophota bacterium]|jgi:tRNA(Arg) A34 adenosine deaminase TadA|nr:nucleoside deaminase [Candidatus Omnitrophota bacterium]HPW64664.1 nucleoside deaminase [Candidatus Omnitrophota bacterium]HQB93666.1 nucleoside deaminase [Candidatus Omnitrophota bacterium]
MKLAIRTAAQGMKKNDGGPFGACIVRNGRVIATAHNTVLLKKDATCHAEVNAIREASRKLRRFDLSDCVIYSTTEPCPMCFSAIHWARIPLVIWGTAIADVARLGFNELSLPNSRMKRYGKSPVKSRGKFLLKECRALLEKWERMDSKKIY